MLRYTAHDDRPKCPRCDEPVDGLDYVDLDDQHSHPECFDLEAQDREAERTMEVFERRGS